MLCVSGCHVLHPHLCPHSRVTEEERWVLPAGLKPPCTATCTLHAWHCVVLCSVLQSSKLDELLWHALSLDAFFSAYSNHYLLFPFASLLHKILHSDLVTVAWKKDHTFMSSLDLVAVMRPRCLSGFCSFRACFCFLSIFACRSMR